MVKDNSRFLLLAGHSASRTMRGTARIGSGGQFSGLFGGLNDGGNTTASARKHGLAWLQYMQ